MSGKNTRSNMILRVKEIQDKETKNDCKSVVAHNIDMPSSDAAKTRTCSVVAQRLNVDSYMVESTEHCTARSVTTVTSVFCYGGTNLVCGKLGPS